MDNFINALNTTLLKSLNINKADNEFDEVIVIEEHDENEQEDVDRSGTYSNDETITPDNKNSRQIEKENNYKSLANMTLGTLSATRKMQDRIKILEKYKTLFLNNEIDFNFTKWGDCFTGIRRKKFDQANEVLESFRDEEIEVTLFKFLSALTWLYFL